MVKLKFRVRGLKSIYCAQVLQHALDQLTGVTSYVSYKKAYVEVYASADQSMAALQRIASKEGYHLEPLTDNTAQEPDFSGVPPYRYPDVH